MLTMLAVSAVAVLLAGCSTATVANRGTTASTSGASTSLDVPLLFDPGSTTGPVLPPTKAPVIAAVAPEGPHLGTLPPGSRLPGDAACAARVRPGEEVRPGNAGFNSVRGVQQNLTTPYPTFGRVDGDFTGTTDEILQWVACKWGIDEDVVRAQAAVESWWNQTNLGDWTSDKAVCAPNHPVGSDPAHPGQCPESVGILQVRYQYWRNGFNEVEASTAYNADYVYAAWRACYEGNDGWLNTVDHVGTYGPGDLWGCVGLWFSGRWHTPPAEAYITMVKSYLKARVWAHADFS